MVDTRARQLVLKNCCNRESTLFSRSGHQASRPSGRPGYPSVTSRVAFRTGPGPRTPTDSQPSYTHAGPASSGLTNGCSSVKCGPTPTLWTLGCSLPHLWQVDCCCCGSYQSLSVLVRPWGTSSCVGRGTIWRGEITPSRCQSYWLLAAAPEEFSRYPLTFYSFREYVLSNATVLLLLPSKVVINHSTMVKGKTVLSFEEEKKNKEHTTHDSTLLKTKLLILVVFAFPDGKDWLAIGWFLWSFLTSFWCCSSFLPSKLVLHFFSYPTLQ